MCVITLCISVFNICKQSFKLIIIMFYCFITFSVCVTALIMVYDYIFPTKIFREMDIGRFSFHEFFTQLVIVCNRGIFLIVAASMLQLGFSFDLVFFHRNKSKTIRKQRISITIFLIFIFVSLSVLFAISFFYKAKEKYNDNEVMAFVRVCFDLMVIMVNFTILAWLHMKLRNFKSDKIREQMKKVKVQFTLINLAFIVLVAIDGIRLYVAFYENSGFLRIVLENTYSIILFIPINYVLITHLKVKHD